MKQQFKLTESDLHNVIKGAVQIIIKEYTDSEKKRMYGSPHDDEDLKKFNEQPTNDIVGEGKIKVTEETLKEIIKESVKNVLSELDWRTVANAAGIAAGQSHNDKLQQGIRRKRMDQWQNFNRSIRPTMMKQYGLSNDEVADAIKGKGPFYQNASRKALKSMDKLNADYDKFYSNEPGKHGEYKDGKWQ